MGNLRVKGTASFGVSDNALVKINTDGGLLIDLNTSGGWARGIYYSINDTMTPCFGMYGGSSSVNYFYVGNAYNEAWMRVAPDGTVSANTFVGSLNGNASTASKWLNARTLSLTGAVVGSASIDGSNNVSLDTTLSWLSTSVSVTTSEAGWFDVAHIPKSQENSVRGITEFYVRSTGGALTPSTVKITFDLSWSCAVNSIKLEGSSSIVGGARLVSATDDYRIQVYFNAAYSENVEIGRIISQAGVFNRNNAWIWFSGALVWYTRSGVQGSCSHSRPGISVSNYLSQRDGYLCLDTGNYSSYALPLSGGTMNGHIILPADKAIIQFQASGSNYTTPIMWYKGGVSQGDYDPQIGHHNTGGDGTGSMVLLPYTTSTPPWYGSVGLYLTQSEIKFNEKPLLHTGNYSTWVMPISYWNWSGQSGQPTWLWGGNEYGKWYVYNPSNFSVNYANYSGYSTYTTMDGTMSLQAEYNNEINFGGSNNSSIVYFGYRAAGNKSIPTQFVFGGSTGTATITANHFNGNAKSATIAGGVNYVTNYKSVSPGTGSSTAGWYRCFQFAWSNSSSPTCILHIGRSYNSPQNEGYVFAVTCGYNGDVQITQLSGGTGGHLIRKIRVDWTNSGAAYIDFYMNEQSYNNTIYVYGSGMGEFFDPYKVSSATGYTTEFDTVAGFKSGRCSTTNYGASSRLNSSGNIGEIFYVI